MLVPETFNFRLIHLREKEENSQQSKNGKSSKVAAPLTLATGGLVCGADVAPIAVRLCRADLHARQDDFQRGNMNDLDRSRLMYVLVTSSRLRGLQVQTCVSTHAVTGRIGAEPSDETRCFISCEPPRFTAGSLLAISCSEVSKQFDM